MGFFSFLKKTVTTVAKVAAPVVLTIVQPEALVNVAMGSVVKHALGRVPNDAIPYLNLGVSTLASFARHVPDQGWEASLLPALQEGGLLAGLSTALHQSIKLPTKGALSINGKTL